MTNTLQLSPSILERAIEQDPYLKSIHTKRQYKSDLKRFQAWRAGRPLTKSLAETYAADLQARGFAPATINQHLASIRWLARWIVDFAHDYAPDPGAAQEIIEQAARVAKVRDVRGSRPPRGRHMTRDEIAALLATCKDGTNAGVRDRCLFILARFTGLRRDELCKIRIDDLSHTPDGYQLRIQHGKGDKYRDVPLAESALAALDAWIEIRGKKSGYLFTKVNKGDTIHKNFEKPLSGQALADIATKRGDQAGVKVDGWHNFRRTLAGDLWNAQVDGSTIQDILGHANQNQTKKYDRRTAKRKHAAVQKIEVL